MSLLLFVCTHTDKHSQGCILYINTNNKDLSRCKANTEWGIMTGLRQIIYERGCNWTLQILQLWVMDEQERAYASVLHMILSLAHALHKLYRFIPAYLQNTHKSDTCSVTLAIWCNTSEEVINCHYTVLNYFNHSG